MKVYILFFGSDNDINKIFLSQDKAEKYKSEKFGNETYKDFNGSIVDMYYIEEYEVIE